MRCRGFADSRAKGGLDHHVFVIGANLLENLGGPVWIEVVNERGIQTHHEAFTGRNTGRFFQRLRLDGEFVISLQRVDEVHALAETLTRNSSEEREHTHVPCTNSGHGTEQQNHQQESGNAESDQAKHSTATATINYSPSSWVKDCHRFLPLAIIRRRPRGSRSSKGLR